MRVSVYMLLAKNRRKDADRIQSESNLHRHSNELKLDDIFHFDTEPEMNMGVHAVHREEGPAHRVCLFMFSLRCFAKKKKSISIKSIKLDTCK